MTDRRPIYVRDCDDPTGQLYIDHGGGRLEPVERSAPIHPVDAIVSYLKRIGVEFAPENEASLRAFCDEIIP